MILRCQAVTVTRNRKGQPIRAAKVVAGDPITLGRGGDATVHLPDPRVRLRHAVIRNDSLGKLHVEALEGGIDVNGELRGRAKLRRGDRILIGPYQITPEPPTGGDHDFTLAIELVHPFPEAAADFRTQSRLTLSSTWLSKRSLAWALFVAIAALGFAFPLAYATSPAFKAASETRFPSVIRNVVWDAAWDPGPLSPGHESLSRKCAECHQIPFAPIEDRACVKCHAVVGGHVSAASVSAGVEISTRCAACHRDHKGENALVRTDGTLCVSCHAEIQSGFPHTSIASVSDFARDHPEFALSVLKVSTGEVERVPADRVPAYREASGLKFSHQQHLAVAGIRSPAGLRVMECVECHSLEPDASRFRPVQMLENCSECHRLEFEPTVTARQAPHGEPAQLLTSLREFYARVALGERPIDVTIVDDLLRRSGPPADRIERQNALAWAEGKAQAVASEMIERRLCVQCHDVTRLATRPRTPDFDGGPEWSIAPVKLTERWLPGAAFDHQTHRISTCETCHHVRASTTSADIAMPTLATCRSCHVGSGAVQGKVRSPCETCHRYHQRASPLPPRTVARVHPISEGPK